jgi:hypothetical protein
LEKEAYSTVESMIRFDHIVGVRHKSLYTDLSNRVYNFDPYGQNTGITRHTASQLMRYAVKTMAGDVLTDFHDGQSVHVPLSPDWLDL